MSDDVTWVMRVEIQKRCIINKRRFQVQLIHGLFCALRESCKIMHGNTQMFGRESLSTVMMFNLDLENHLEGDD